MITKKELEEKRAKKETLTSQELVLERVYKTMPVVPDGIPTEVEYDQYQLAKWLECRFLCEKYLAQHLADTAVQVALFEKRCLSYIEWLPSKNVKELKK